MSISSEPVSRHCLLGNIVMDRTMLSVVFKNQEHCCECEPDGGVNQMGIATHLMAQSTAVLFVHEQGSA